MEVGCSGSGVALLLMFTIAIGAELTRDADPAMDTAAGESHRKHGDEAQRRREVIYYHFRFLVFRIKQHVDIVGLEKELLLI